MSMFGKSQRYLSVLQKVSDLEMRLEAVRTDVDRQTLATTVSEIPSGADEATIAEEIEARFRAVLAEAVPTLVAEVRSNMEENWDLEAVIGKEVFRLLENHLPELTAQELTEDEVSAVTEEVSRRVSRDVEGLVESKLSQLLPLVERENGSAAATNDLRPRLDQLSDGMRRAWEEVARLKMTTRKLTKQLEAMTGKGKGKADSGPAKQVPEQLMGRASIADLVKEQVSEVVSSRGKDSERRIAEMEDRLTKLSRVLETGPAILDPAKVTATRAPVGAGAAAPSTAVNRRAPKKPLSEQEKEAAFDQILNTTLRIRER